MLDGALPGERWRGGVGKDGECSDAVFLGHEVRGHTKRREWIRSFCMDRRQGYFRTYSVGEEACWRCGVMFEDVGGWNVMTL